MGEIRSSWEIAQEKADRIGDLSSEERIKQKEEQYHSTANVLVRQYLDDKDIRPVEKELNRYTGEDRELLKRILLEGLIESIDPDDDGSLDPVVRGIQALSGKEGAGRGMDAVKQLYDELRNVREAEKQRVDDAGRQMLRAMGISGSAISTINLYARDEWMNTLKNIDADFKKQMADLKKDILK